MTNKYSIGDRVVINDNIKECHTCNDGEYNDRLPLYVTGTIVEMDKHDLELPYYIELDNFEPDTDWFCHNCVDLLIKEY